jgi:hypothetical protein
LATMIRYLEERISLTSFNAIQEHTDKLTYINVTKNIAEDATIT